MPAGNRAKEASTRARPASMLAIAFFLAAGLSASSPIGARSAGEQANVTVVYVGADDCAPCRIWRRDHSLPEGTPKPLADALLSTHPELLEETLEQAIAAHGGVPLLLERGLGLDAPRLKALRDTYLE